MNSFKKLVLILLVVAIVLSCLSIIKLNSSNNTNTKKEVEANVATTPTVAEVCGQLRTAFIKSSSSSLNFKNCLVLSDSSLEVSVWSSVDKPIKPELVQNYNDTNLPQAQAKSMCETFFRSFPILKNVKFVVLADDQNSVLMNFDMTSDVCNQSTRNTLNGLSNQDVQKTDAESTNTENKGKEVNSTKIEEQKTESSKKNNKINEEKNNLSSEKRKEELSGNDKKAIAEEAVPTQGNE